jgi:hypothetical protein
MQITRNWRTKSVGQSILDTDEPEREAVHAG